MRINHTTLIQATLFLASVFLTACGGGGGGGAAPPPATYSISGTVTGLSNGQAIQLKNNGADTITVTGDGSSLDAFIFPTKISGSYAVTVVTPLTIPNRRCTVTPSGSGTASADVTNVVVNCVVTYTISATISGLGASIGLVLQDKWETTNSDILAATSDTTFNFSQQLINGETYSVRALIQPAAPAKSCTVTGGDSGIGSGIVAGSGVNVTVTCAPPVPRYAYVTNQNSDNVSAFEIGASGVLVSAASAVSSGDGPFFITVDPTGQFAYEVNANSNDLSAFKIDAASGVLTQIDCVPNATTTCNNLGGFAKNYLAGANVHALTVDPTGQFLYVANAASGDISAYTINETTGALTQIDCGGGSACNVAYPLPKNFLAGIQTSSVTVDHTGKFLYATNAEEGVSAYAINPTTGALTQVKCGVGYVCETTNGNGDNFLAGAGDQSLDIDPTSRFVYVANGAPGENSISAFKIESDGSLSQIVCGAPADLGCDTVTGVNFLAGAGPVSLAVSPLGNYLYVANSLSNDISVYNIDSAGGTGVLSETGSSPFAVNVAAVPVLDPTPSSVSVDLLGDYVYVANYNAGIAAFSILAGVLTQIDCGTTASVCETTNSGGWDFEAGSNPNSITTAVQQ